MSPQNLPVDAVMARFEELVRDDVVPTRSKALVGAMAAEATTQKSFTTPHPVFRVELRALAEERGLWSETVAQQVGWQAMVFDGEMPVSTPEIAVDSTELATSGNEDSANDLARALEIARETAGRDDMEYAVVRVPHFMTALVLLAQRLAIPLPSRHLPDHVEPFRPYDVDNLSSALRDAARAELERFAQVSDRQVSGAPPHTF